MRSSVALVALLGVVTLAGCVTGPAAVSTDEPTETRPFPPSPTPAPIPEGTFLAGPMTAECPGQSSWHYPPMERLTESSNRTWSTPAEAMRTAEAILNESHGQTTDLRRANGTYTAVGWRGSVVNVTARYDPERYAFGRAPEVDSADVNVLVLGFSDHTEIVVYRTLGYC